jgi:hypothetical protein
MYIWDMEKKDGAGKVPKAIYEDFLPIPSVLHIIAKYVKENGETRCSWLKNVEVGESQCKSLTCSYTSYKWTQALTFTGETHFYQNKDILFKIKQVYQESNGQIYRTLKLRSRHSLLCGYLGIKRVEQAAVLLHCLRSLELQSKRETVSTEI